MIAGREEGGAPAWTGGQFSIARVIICMMLMKVLMRVDTWENGYVVSSAWLSSVVPFAGVWLLPTLSAVMCMVCAAGVAQRTSALLVTLLGIAALGVPSPALLVEDASWATLLPIASLFVAVAPEAPYGSFPALGRVDPGGVWRLGEWFPHAAAACVAAAWAGYATVFMDSEWFGRQCLALVAVSAVLWRSAFLRPFVWLCSLMVSLECTGLLALHVVAMEPSRWFAPLAAPHGRQDRVFYDGDCGLCHRFLRFVLAESVDAQDMVFSPLQSPYFEQMVSQRSDVNGPLPDSVIVETAGGALLMRSGAAFYVMRRIGGFWRVVGELGMLLPRWFRDLAYDTVARVRHLLFAKPKDGPCPMLPRQHRSRFVYD